MSRTYRKPRELVEQSEEAYINYHINHHQRYGFEKTWIRRRKSDEKYKAEVEAANKKYQELLKKASYDDQGHPYLFDRGCWWTMYKNYVRKPYVAKYERVAIPWSREQEIEKVRAYYRTLTRDGTHTETSRKTGFKRDCAKMTRRGNRRLENAILKDDDYDHMPYPNEHDGDFLRWVWW